MTAEGDADPQVFYPSLRYEDAAAAIEWLEEAFGFTLLAAHRGEDGSIGHAEMTYGDGVVMLGSDSASAGEEWGDHAGLGWVYVVTNEPDELFKRSAGAGAEVVRPLSDQDYGSRDFSVRDPEGNIWSFGTYSPER